MHCTITQHACTPATYPECIIFSSISTHGGPPYYERHRRVCLYPVVLYEWIKLRDSHSERFVRVRTNAATRQSVVGLLISDSAAPVTQPGQRRFTKSNRRQGSVVSYFLHNRFPRYMPAVTYCMKDLTPGRLHIAKFDG